MASRCALSRQASIPRLTDGVTTLSANSAASQPLIRQRGHLRRGPRPARRRAGPQPLQERGPPHRPVRPVLLLDHRPLVHLARPPSQRRRRPPLTGPLVHHQDRPGLRRHARQAPPNDHRRPISPRGRRPADQRRNPGRPASLGPSRTRPRSLITPGQPEARKSSGQGSERLPATRAGSSRQSLSLLVGSMIRLQLSWSIRRFSHIG